jgi:hypothetical protein
MASKARFRVFALTLIALGKVLAHTHDSAIWCATYIYMYMYTQCMQYNLRWMTIAFLKLCSLFQKLIDVCETYVLAVRPRVHFPLQACPQCLHRYDQFQRPKPHSRLKDHRRAPQQRCTNFTNPNDTDYSILREQSQLHNPRHKCYHLHTKGSTALSVPASKDLGSSRVPPIF